ncbi:hypothetical protein FSC37_17895 [Piscinibacter aquaticus]|uniref:Uncharacterized protein n=1 Tax=Piscinibacter aquaticus TaxID=392597 RepID=A0A5C6U2Z0_9BURK|nr:hypothetical protein FSC37_17895 [Piscinibacter aquaticus]
MAEHVELAVLLADEDGRRIGPRPAAARLRLSAAGEAGADPLPLAGSRLLGTTRYWPSVKRAQTLPTADETPTASSAGMARRACTRAASSKRAAPAARAAHGGANGFECLQPRAQAHRSTRRAAARHAAAARAAAAGVAASGCIPAPAATCGEAAARQPHHARGGQGQKAPASFVELVHALLLSHALAGG